MTRGDKPHCICGWKVGIVILAVGAKFLIIMFQILRDETIGIFGPIKAVKPLCLARQCLSCHWRWLVT